MSRKWKFFPGPNQALGASADPPLCPDTPLYPRRLLLPPTNTHHSSHTLGGKIGDQLCPPCTDPAHMCCHRRVKKYSRRLIQGYPHGEFTNHLCCLDRAFTRRLNSVTFIMADLRTFFQPMGFNCFLELSHLKSLSSIIHLANFRVVRAKYQHPRLCVSIEADVHRLICIDGEDSPESRLTDCRVPRVVLGSS